MLKALNEAMLKALSIRSRTISPETPPLVPNLRLIKKLTAVHSAWKASTLVPRIRAGRIRTGVVFRASRQFIDSPLGKTMSQDALPGMLVSPFGALLGSRLLPPHLVLGCRLSIVAFRVVVFLNVVLLLAAWLESANFLAVRR